MDDDQQFCLRWNNHQSTLISVFDTLLENGTLVDCTLAAEGKFLKAHKVVLSACSPYFATLLSQQYDKHPIFILKDVKFQELRAMMDYMYRGEVNISQDQLAALLKAAESLQIKGLSDNRSSSSSGSSGLAGGVGAHQQQTQQKQQSDASAAAKTLQPPVPASKASGLTIENKRPLKSELLESDVSGSREGSTSPTRKRKKVRRRSVDTNNLLIDNHDQHSNSSSHSIHTASGTGAGATAAGTGGAAVTGAPGAAAASAGASSLSSSAVGGGVGAGGATPGSNSGANVLSAAAVAAAAAIKKTETAQQAAAAAELMKLQLQKQQIAAAAAAAVAAGQSSDDEERCGGPGSVATGTEHGDDGNELTDNEQDGDGGSSVKSGARHHHHREGRRGNKTSTSTVGDLLLEPKSEYEDGQDENIEDLTMDDEELMDELDQAGPSHGGDVSSQGYAQWPLDREQNEAFIAAQDAVGGQHRDAQVSVPAGGGEASGNDGGPSGGVGAEGAGSSSTASGGNDHQHQHHTGTVGGSGGHSFVVHSIDSGANSGNLSNNSEGGKCGVSSDSSSSSNSGGCSSSGGSSNNAVMAAAVAVTALALNQQQQHQQQQQQHQQPALSVGSSVAATAAAVAALVGGNVMADYIKSDAKGGFPLTSLASPPIGGDGEGSSSQQQQQQQQHLVTATSLQLQSQSQPLSLQQLKHEQLKQEQQQQQQQQQHQLPTSMHLLSPKSPPLDDQPCDLRMLTPATYLRELASGASKDSIAAAAVAAVQLAASANTGSASTTAALPMPMFKGISMTSAPPPPAVPLPIVGGTYSCARCGNSYARPHSLNRHIRFECGVEPKFECPVCHKKSKHKHNLVLHMRTHQHR